MVTGPQMVEVDSGFVVFWLFTLGQTSNHIVEESWHFCCCLICFSLNLINGPHLFTTSGYKYYHTFNISLCSDRRRDSLHPLASCYSNVSIDEAEQQVTIHNPSKFLIWAGSPTLTQHCRPIHSVMKWVMISRFCALLSSCQEESQ